jgi:hypothetical protein
MLVHVVVGVLGGCLADIEVFADINDARKARDGLAKTYGLSNKDKPDNQHSQECRWNDENEIHLHSVELELDLSKLYQVERKLSFMLQPQTSHDKVDIQKVRDELRKILLEMDWKAHF